MDHSTAPETALVVAVIAFYGFVILVGVAACVLWIAALIDSIDNCAAASAFGADSWNRSSSPRRRRAWSRQ